MDKQSPRFLSSWALACILFSIVVSAVGMIMDPYLVFGTPRIPGFNARKPGAHTQDRMAKTYDVLRAVPNTLILGGSRVNALDSQNPIWPAEYRPVYNISLAWGIPYTSYRYMQHVMAHRHVELVVVGLDFEAFLAIAEADHPNDPEFEARLAVTSHNADADQNRQRILDRLRAIGSLDGLAASVEVAVANAKDQAMDLVGGNLEFEHRTSEVGSSYAQFIMMDMFGVGRYRGGRNKFAAADIEAILSLCKSHGTGVILVINPVHADTLEIMDLLGYWGAFEEWKRELLTLATRYQSNGHPIPLWDFSGYDRYSTEIVSRERAMHWFLDPTHYSKALGNVIISRIFGTGESHFGMLLSSTNIEAHLANIRRQQQWYRDHHREGVRRVRDVYNVVNRVSSQAVVRP